MLLLMFALPNRFDRRQGMKKQQTITGLLPWGFLVMRGLS